MHVVQAAPDFEDIAVKEPFCHDAERGIAGNRIESGGEIRHDVFRKCLRERRLCNDASLRGQQPEEEIAAAFFRHHVLESFADQREVIRRLNQTCENGSAGFQAQFIKFFVRITDYRV